MVHFCAECQRFKTIKDRQWTAWQEGGYMTAQQFANRQTTICPDCYKKLLEEKKNEPHHADR